MSSLNAKYQKVYRENKMKYLSQIAVIIGALVLSSCAEPEVKQEASKILTNAVVWTGVDAQPWANTIVIDNDRIVAVGDEALASQYNAGQVIDAVGNMILPGFIDNHVHFMDGSSSLASVQTIDATTEQQFANIIMDYAKTMPNGEWMLGGIWDHEKWGGTLPHKDWIDEGTEDNPIFLYRTDGHIGFVNSKALELAGVTKDTPDPEGGVIVRDADGEPTGTLIDTAMYLVSRIYPAPSDDRIDVIFDTGIQEALENGVTQVHSIDMGVWDNLPIFKRAKEQERLKIRVNYYTHISKRHELAKMIDSEGKGDNWLRFGGVKVMADGALGSGTAWFYEPFSDEPDNSGFPIRPMDELKTILQESHDYGFQLAIHAIGDKANDEVLSIIDEIGAKDNRPRIEHAQHLKKHALERFKELNVTAAAHPYHVYDDGRFAEGRIGKERLSEIYSFRSLMDAGVNVSFGSDWFVSPMRPLLGIYVATTRHTADGKNPTGWIPEEKVTVEQAVKAYTTNNAWIGNQENDLGTIEAGKLADLVIISDNIFEIDPADIKDTKVLMTIINGDIKYRAD